MIIKVKKILIIKRMFLIVLVPVPRVSENFCWFVVSFLLKALIFFSIASLFSLVRLLAVIF